MKNTRTAKVARENNVFEDILPIDIKKEMIFMIFEPTGEPVFDGLGFCVFKAESDAYYNNDGVIVIETEISQ